MARPAREILITEDNLPMLSRVNKRGQKRLSAKIDMALVMTGLGVVDLIDNSEIVQMDPICISLTQGIQTHLNELEARLRLLSEPDSVTKEGPTA